MASEAGSERGNNGIRKAMAVGAIMTASFLPMAEAQADKMPNNAEKVLEDSENLFVNDRLEFIDIHTGEPINEPLIRTLHGGDGIVDLAEAMLGPEIASNNRIKVRLLAQTILKANGYSTDLSSKEAKSIPKGTEIKLPQETEGLELIVVQDGDTTARIFNETNWDEEASFDEFLSANAIIDKDHIVSGWKLLPPHPEQISRGEAAVNPENQPEPTKPRKPNSAPETPPILPPNNKSQISQPEQPVKSEPDIDSPPPQKPAIVTFGSEIKNRTERAGHLDINDSLIELDNARYMDQDDAESAVDLLITATRKLENPYSDIPDRFLEQERPSPVADRLESERKLWIDKLVSGEANAGFMQNWTIRQLARDYGGNINHDVKMGIAMHYVEYVAEQNKWQLTRDEVEVLSEMVVKGVGVYEPDSLRYAEINGVVLDERDDISLTVDLLNESMESHLEEQMELAAMADEQLEVLDKKNELKGLEDADYERIARNMIRTRQNGQEASDYLFEVLTAKSDGMDLRDGLDLVNWGILESQASADLLKLFPKFNKTIDGEAESFLQAEGAKDLASFTETIDQHLEAKITEITEHAGKLDKLQADIDQINPKLEKLDSDILYEIAKIVLSQKEREEAGPDSWYYLVEAKTTQAGTELGETVLGMVEGIYSAADAELLWQQSPAEREAAAVSVNEFIVSGEPNLKKYLDGTFESLETRIASAQGQVDELARAVKVALPDAVISDLDVMTLSMDFLAGKNNHQIMESILENYEEATGREISEYSLAVVDLEMLKLESSGRQDALVGISDYLHDFFGAKGAMNHIESVDRRGNVTFTDYDPAVQTLAQMILEGDYSIQRNGEYIVILSEKFEDMLRNYDTNPASLFPGTHWLIKGYAGEDLTPFFNRLGVDTGKILTSPFNVHVREADGKIIAENSGSIWFDAIHTPGKSAKDFEDAVDWVYGEIPGFPYTVKKGDTYSSIAQMFRVDGQVPDWNKIIEWNRGRISSDPTKLKVGENIVLPPEWSVHIDLDFPVPRETAPDEAEVSTGTPENIFKQTGLEIKGKLQSNAPNKESGHLKPEQLDRIGSQWSDHSLYPDAAEAFRMMSDAFETEFDRPLEVVSSYRSYEGQVATKKWWADRGKAEMAATPGKSNHGWGLAIDFGDQDHSTDEAALDFSHEEYEWLRDNSERFGWINPEWARDGQGVEEAWHFEYVGKPEMTHANPETSYPTLERYEPGSQEFIQLFTAAADYLGVPREWAQDESLVKLVSHESDGWVGVPNYTYGDRKKDKGEWDEIHEELKDGEITAKSSATGLGQLLSKNAAKYYPSGVEGIGVGFEEAIGTLAYIEKRYGDPDTAWGNHSANPDRWKGVEKIYESEGY